MGAVLHAELRTSHRGLYFFKWSPQRYILIQKVFQGANVSLGISCTDVSRLMPVWPTSKFGSSVSTIAAAVTKAFAGEGVFFGKSVLVFWGGLPSLFLSGEN